VDLVQELAVSEWDQGLQTRIKWILCTIVLAQFKEEWLSSKTQRAVLLFKEGPPSRIMTTTLSVLLTTEQEAIGNSWKRDKVDRGATPRAHWSDLPVPWHLPYRTISTLEKLTWQVRNSLRVQRTTSKQKRSKIVCSCPRLLRMLALGLQSITDILVGSVVHLNPSQQN
jgi:hypothetical protein